MVITKKRTRALVLILAVLVALSMWAVFDTTEAQAAPVVKTVAGLPDATKGWLYLSVYDSGSDRWGRNDPNSGSYASYGNASYNSVTKLWEITYDSKYDGRTATLEWDSYDSTVSATQVLGGWFGGITEGDAKFTQFKLPAVPASFPLTKGATVTLTASPKCNMYDALGSYNSNYTTYVAATAWRVGKTKKGGPALYSESVYPSSTGTSTTGRYDVKTGKFTFTNLQPGKKYLFSVTGNYKTGSDWNSYVTVWYGGYRGANVDTPKKIKSVTAPKAGKSKTIKGTLKLVKYKGGVKGKIAGGDYVHFSNPVTGISEGMTANAAGAYSIDLPPGVYYASYNGTVKVVTVKKKKVKANFSAKALPSVNYGNISTSVSGTFKSGAALKARSVAYAKGYGVKAKNVKFKYYWTNGTKILSTKSSYKVSKSVAKAGKLFVITVVSYKKHASSYEITAVSN